MGCCEVKRKQEGAEPAATVFPIRVARQTSSVTNCRHGKLTEVLELLRKHEDFESLAELLDNETPVTPEEYPRSLASKNCPSTVGGLALCLLTQEAAATETDYFLPICIKSSKALVSHLSCNTSNSSLEALHFLFMTLSSQDNNLKEALLIQNIFPPLVQLMQSSERELRIAATLTAASVYKNHSVAQERFLQHGGGDQLIELIKREGQCEAVLLRLLNCFEALVSAHEGFTKVQAAMQAACLPVFQTLQSIHLDETVKTKLEALSRLCS